MNQIFEYNNLQALKSKKVIIYGCFKSAREFAVRLLNQNIAFDAFLFPNDEEKYILPYFFNKPVVNVLSCRSMGDFVIAVSFSGKEQAEETLRQYQLDSHIVEIEQMARGIVDAANVVMYGTGGRGERFYQDSKGLIDIRYVCDSKAEKSGTFWNGIEIVNPAYFSDAPDNTVVIVASTYVHEICETLYSYHVREEDIFLVTYNELSVCKNRINEFKINQNTISDILRDVKGRHTVIYGEKETVRNLVCQFQCLDVIFDDVVTRNSEEEDGTVFNLAYRNKDSMFVIADKYSKRLQENLQELGICEKNVIWLEKHNSRLTVDREFETMLDPNIGHAYARSDDEYPGFVRYEYLGNTRKKPIRIVTLGGSTTMSYWIKGTSWSEYLSDILKENDIPHVIYCGGVDAYNASSELMKLIRDAIWIRPDIVISYSGTNNKDISYVNKNPFISYYQEDFFEKVASKVKVKVFGRMHSVNYGVVPDVSEFEFFYQQLEMMHAVCEAAGIHYQAFLQPMLTDKRKYFDADGELAILDDWLFDKTKREYVSVPGGDRKLQEFLKHAKEFTKAAGEKRAPWFTDLTKMFDDIDGVYMDRCHIYDRGNDIAANRIYEELSDVFAMLQQ